MKVLLSTDVFGTKGKAGLTGIGRSLGYKLIRKGEFPCGHVLPNGRRAWFASEIEAWAKSWAEAHPAPQRKA